MLALLGLGKKLPAGNEERASALFDAADVDKSGTVDFEVPRGGVL